MDNNVSKNTFYCKFFQLEILVVDLAIEQLLKQQILEAIKLYRGYEENFSEFEYIKTLVNDKIVLYHFFKHRFCPIKYRCAIAFPLANYWQLSSLTVAHKLQEHLPTTKTIEPTKNQLEFQIQIIPPGWLDFYLSDRTLAVWVGNVVGWIERTDREDKGDRGDKGDMFALQYVHARCCALLRLGEQASLIKINNRYSTAWVIVEPSPLSWLDIEGNFLLVHPTEKFLLFQLLTVVEQLIINSQNTNWAKLAHSMSEAWLDFWAECRIWDEINRENPELAIARLGLVALVQYFLNRLLQDKLSVSPLTNL